MANLLPPMPSGVPPGSYWWNDWYEKLRNMINGLSTLAHNSLQSIQGGTTNQYYHLTAAQYGYFSSPTGTTNIVLSDSPTFTTQITSPKVTYAGTLNITGTGSSGVVAIEGSKTGASNDAVTIYSTAGTGTTASGRIKIKVGDTVGNVQPGTLIISGGDASSTGTLAQGGDVEIYGGAAVRNGGMVRLFGGDASNTGPGASLGGGFELYGGGGYKDGGSANLVGGSASGPAGNGGFAYIKPGTGANSDGTAGLQDSNSIDVVTVGTIVPGGASTLSFYSAVPVIQQTAIGAGGFVNGGGAAVNQGFTSTGGVGATAYTLDDIVAALKNYGLLTQ